MEVSQSYCLTVLPDVGHSGVKCWAGGLVWVLVLVLRINWGAGSVSACALRPGPCGGDVEEGLGLPQLGSPLQVIHVGCGGLCV